MVNIAFKLFPFGSLFSEPNFYRCLQKPSMGKHTLDSLKHSKHAICRRVIKPTSRLRVFMGCLREKMGCSRVFYGFSKSGFFAEKWVVPERLWVFMGRFQGFMGRFWVFEMQPAFRTLKTDYILFGDQLPLK